MVTAGIFMVARMSPLFEYSEYALNFVLFIGATTALFMGFLGIINNDIKRVIAYSTLSQLGYMTVALGVSGYAFGIFHLMTHAFFKALLFLAAGSVIIGMHHEQDMRKMGGLFKYMKITAITCWIGALALVGTPFFSGFYSKDLLIDAVHEKILHQPNNWIAGYAYFCVVAGVFVTAFYTFRMLFMTFHGKPRWQEAAAHAAHAPVDQAAHDPHAETHPMPHGEHDTIGHEEEHDHHGGPPHESPWVVWVPLVLLAIPSIVIGLLTVQPLLFGGGFGSSIFVNEAHNVVPELHEEFGNWLRFALSSFAHPVLYLVIAGFVAAWALYIKWPHLPGVISQKLRPLVFVLENKYGFDWFNEKVLAAAGRLLGKLFWKVGDQGIIDGAAVNGSASAIDFFAGVVRRVQSGFLYSYAFWMVIGLAAMLGWFLTH
jgi:NADH-quinone oxidoreductase subunit L